MKLYHYSTEKFDTLLTRHKRGGLTTEQIKQAVEKAILLDDVGAYIDHISLFIEPIPTDTIAKIFNDSHPFWKSGRTIYEHVVDTSDLDKDISFILVETPIISKFTDQFDWSNPSKEERVRYIRLMHKEMRRLKLIGVGVNSLIAQVTPYIGGTEQAFIKARQSEWAEDTKEQYAAEVPHLMVYPKNGGLKVSSVKKITLGNKTPNVSIDLFHLSFNDKLPKVMKPRQPMDSSPTHEDPISVSVVVGKQFTEQLPPRVSFSPSVQECFSALYPNIGHYFEKENYPYMDMWVYVPLREVKRIDDTLVKEKVWDAHITNEVCFIEPVPVEKVAQIRIFNPYLKNGKITEIRAKPFNNPFFKEEFVAPKISFKVVKVLKPNAKVL